MEDFWIQWLLSALVMLGFMIWLGNLIKGRPAGILIDGRNKMSLSKFQMVLWTWLIVSTLVVLMFVGTSVDVELGATVLTLMGIGVGSTAGAALVKGAKMPQQVDVARAPGMQPGSILHRVESPKGARWSDMFKGEESGDHDYIDIAKVQMFFFTLIVWAGYIYVLYSHDFGLSGGVKPVVNVALEFPAFSEGLLVLIGISHAGYLTVKAAPKTPSV